MGEIGSIFIHDINLSEKDFARHTPIYDFLLEREEDDLLNELPDEDAKKLEKLLKKKFKE